MTETKSLSLFQRRGAEIYGFVGAVLLLWTWALAGAAMAEFGPWAAKMWGVAALSAAFFAMSMKAAEVRKARTV